MAKASYNTKKLRDALLAVTTQGQDIDLDYSQFAAPVKPSEAALAQHLNGALFGYSGNEVSPLTLQQQREDEADREKSALTNVFDWMSAPMYAVQNSIMDAVELAK